MTTGSPRCRAWAGVVGLFAAALGCTAAVPHVNPPDALHYRTWENADPTPETHPDSRAVTAAGLSARLTPDRAVPAPACDLPPRPLNVLALSGGGKFSAFDAGLLNGWTAHGTRPTFDVVTGISSGALTALYAFLGPKYDEKVKTNYLTVRREHLFKVSVHKINRTAAIASSEPLKAYIANDTTPEVLADVRAAHAAGRRLYIGTNNLTLHRPVIWDVGAIACSGRPDADELVRRIFLAACSIPAWTPPVEFDVTVNGVAYKELHTDAGNQIQAFVQTPNGLPAGSNVFVMAAGKEYPDSLVTRPRFFGMVIAGVTESLYALYRADMLTIYALCAATDSRFHTVCIPPAFRGKPSSLSFDPQDLQRLYDMGYAMCAHGVPWQATPPGVLPGVTNVPRTGLGFVVR